MRLDKRVHWQVEGPWQVQISVITAGHSRMNGVDVLDSKDYSKKVEKTILVQSIGGYVYG